MLQDGGDDMIQSSPHHFPGRGGYVSVPELLGQCGQIPGLDEPLSWSHAVSQYSCSRLMNSLALSGDMRISSGSRKRSLAFSYIARAASKRTK